MEGYLFGYGYKLTIRNYIVQSAVNFRAKVYCLNDLTKFWIIFGFTIMTNY